MKDPQTEGHMASYIGRRKFLATLGGAAAWPLAARAQQGERVRRVGVLMNGAATETIPQSYVAAFVQELRQLGWTEGRNLRIDVRWNAGDAALARIYAAQLIGLTPDVILTASTTNLTVISKPPTPSQSCSCRSLIPSSKALWRASPSREVISLASACTSFRSAGNGLTCSRRSHQASPGLR